jgi:TolB-like protein
MSEQEPVSGYAFDDVSIDFRSFRVAKGNVTRPLTPRAFDVLRYLVEHRDRLVERRELFERFWPHVIVTDNALTRVIKEIRRALEDDAASPRYIATVPKRGFRFVAGATPTSTAPAGASVAVLPFANLSGSPDAEYLSDGISAAIINLLSEVSGLRVMARTTVFSYKGRLPLEPRRVGAELNVAVVLLGSVSQRDGRLKIGVELVATGDGSLLWGQEFDRDMHDVLGVQREIAQRVAEQLHFKLSAREPRASARASADVDAYHLYLRAYYALYTFTPEGLDRSLDYFNQATARHPGNALAWAGIVEAYFNLSFLSSPLDVWPKAKRSALRALELDPLLAEAHYAMALVSFCFDRDWPTAEAEFRRAIDLKPGYAQAREWYAWSVLASPGASRKRSPSSRRRWSSTPCRLPPTPTTAPASTGRAGSTRRRAFSAACSSSRTASTSPICSSG